MSIIIMHQIQPKGRTANIKITLDSSVDLLGYQQEIDNLTNITSNDLINPENDLEVRRYRFDLNSGIVQYFNFYFYNEQTNSHETKFEALGYTTNEVKLSNTKLQNSFFIMDYYNTYDSYSQQKIFSGYLTKVIYSNQFTFPVYTSGVDNQLYYWHVPKSYLSTFTGTTVYAYVKFSFYDARTGVIRLFYNKDHENYTSPLKQYFRVKLDLAARTWYFLLPYGRNTINAYEMHTAIKYGDRINNTVSNVCALSQSYPKNACGCTANVFNPSSGTYC